MTSRRSLILDTTVRMVFDAALVFSLYMLFAGHNQPGGGFVGGLVAAGAIALVYLAGGMERVRRLASVQPGTFLSVGLGLAVGSALLPLLSGDAPMDHRSFEWDIPILGVAKWTMALPFDSGVYLIVVGLVLMVFQGLGDESDESDDPASKDVTS